MSRLHQQQMNIRIYMCVHVCVYCVCMYIRMYGTVQVNFHSPLTGRSQNGSTSKNCGFIPGKLLSEIMNGQSSEKAILPDHSTVKSYRECLKNIKIVETVLVRH